MKFRDRNPEVLALLAASFCHSISQTYCQVRPMEQHRPLASRALQAMVGWNALPIPPAIHRAPSTLIDLPAALNFSRPVGDALNHSGECSQSMRAQRVVK